jgi:hypothetical protein
MLRNYVCTQGPRVQVTGKAVCRTVISIESDKGGESSRVNDMGIMNDADNNTPSLGA